MAMTVCFKCKHHVNLDPDGHFWKLWFNQVCASPGAIEMTAFNPVTGEHVPNYPTWGEVRPYCQNVNRGNCQFFEKKGAK